ncbi:ATP-binding protein [Streptantibioticus cattleyicolor]|uniref:Regulatory protein n=1 Tax=Streptantibioticus cattleyicolor (strain ATCC 35852 / DSM 46488 / JCM 4925 / NBRC 14057 / NRRL 8057) TaxID=1003195 RepID=F8JJX6_STREN|nr:ATP-binding protein [Streptantibioticus cattleyicolor]AEW98592.1 regulatory protein [Streptantibioticus cattleyicolor NRRL 8057 = DSM 46488]CCB72348.1 putative regulatory protein [Streptantibioticus cattleyicolor NRRL 8057 = DSM 46488]
MELMTQGREVPDLRVEFEGTADCIGRARDRAADFLSALARTRPPTGATCRDDILLAVSELVTNAVRHAPGPLTVCLRPAPDGVEVTVGDTSTVVPRPRPPDLATGTGGFGWPLVRQVSIDVRVLTRPDGKEIRALLPW